MMKRFLICMACLMACIFVKADVVQAKYGAGMVPVNKEGKVCFTAEWDYEWHTKSGAQDLVQKWGDGRFSLKSVKKSQSKFVENKVVFNVCEEIVFSKSWIETDYANMRYTLTFDFSKEGKCVMTMTNISYLYDENREKGDLTLTAEEWITDEHAFKKRKKNEFRKECGKFRIKTIDYFQELEANIKDYLN